MDTISNGYGCDSIITIVLTINTIDTTITQTGNVLHANASGSSYQWLNCTNNYSEINNATNQQYTADIDGNYAVEIIENGCTDTSACYTISISGLQEEITKENIFIYPNPAASTVSVLVTAIDDGRTTLKLTNTTGQIVYSQTTTGNYTKQYLYELNISSLPNGMYFITVQNSSSHFRNKLFIENSK